MKYMTEVICDTNREDFQNMINQFLYENLDQIVVIDIKFSCDKHFNALILYKELE